MSVDDTMAVRAFHKKFRFATDRNLVNDVHAGVTVALDRAAAEMARLAKIMLQKAEFAESRSDWRMTRAHLMTEELSETIKALADNDEVALLDGLADLEYVTQGTAVTYDLPLGQAFGVVHASNMSKDVSDGREIHPVKGDMYIEPDLAQVLKWHRSHR